MAATVPAATPIDRAHLARYTGGDAALDTEILDLFASQLPSTIGALKLSQSDRDWHLFAHTLKGSARAVGAWRLAELGAEAETLRDNRDPQLVAANLAAIEQAAAEALIYINSLKQAGQAA